MDEAGRPPLVRLNRLGFCRLLDQGGWLSNPVVLRNRWLNTIVKNHS